MDTEAVHAHILKDDWHDWHDWHDLSSELPQEKASITTEYNTFEGSNYFVDDYPLNYTKRTDSILK